MVAVQVTVLAPLGPDALHCWIVIGSPVSSEGGAVAVQVMVPPAPPSRCTGRRTAAGPRGAGPVVAGRVATHVSVLTRPGLWH